MNKSEEIILGIYKITSPIGKIYIGYTTNKEKRWKKYKGLYCKSQTYLYRSLKKHGVKKHKFEMIHILNKGKSNIFTLIKKLKKLEIYYIDFYKSFIDDNPEFGMNLTRGGDGGIMSKDTIRKIVAKTTGQKRSDETKEKQRKAALGKKKSANHRKNIGLSKLGKKQSKKAIANRVKSRKGYSHSLNTRKKMRKKKLGKVMCEGTKEKIRIAKLGTKQSKKTRLKRSKSLKNKYPKGKHFNCGRKPSATTIAKIVSKITGLKRNDKTKKRISKALKGNTNCLGKKWSDDRKKNSSGENNHNYGKKASEKTREKQRLAKLGTKQSKKTRLKKSKSMIGKGLGRKASQETRDRQSKAKKGKYVGENSWNTGKKRTKAQNKRNSELRKKEWEVIRQERAIMIF